MPVPQKFQVLKSPKVVALFWVLKFAASLDFGAWDLKFNRAPAQSYRPRKALSP
jgi:hypothetical protein